MNDGEKDDGEERGTLRVEVEGLVGGGMGREREVGVELVDRSHGEDSPGGLRAMRSGVVGVEGWSSKGFGESSGLDACRRLDEEEG